MLKSLLVGLTMGGVTVAIHAVGTMGWIAYLRDRGARSSSHHQQGSLRFLCSTAVVLLLIHFAEVILWGLVYWKVVGGKSFATAEQSIYFSIVTFTSLGYGDVVIEGPWRVLGGIQSMVGLLVFGWSSALLFVVLQRIAQTQGEGNMTNKADAD